MTNENSAPATAPVPTAAPEKPARFVNLRIKLGMLPDPEGRPSFIWLERKDALIIACFVAAGVPLLGISGFSLYAKLWILVAWLATWTVFFMFFEGRELIGQMQGRGAIKPEQLTEQQTTAQGPFYGCMIAVFIWIIVYAVHVTINLVPMHDGSLWRLMFIHLPNVAWVGFWTTPVPYGLIEVFIIAHVWFCTSKINHIMTNIGNVFSKAAPMAERIERNMRG